jgi:hypothetical protein
VVLVFLFAHIPSGFAEDGRRGYDIDAVNLGEVRTGDAKQLGAQGEHWLIPFLPHKSSLPHLLGQTSPWLRSSRCWRYCSSWRSHSAICCWQNSDWWSRTGGRAAARIRHNGRHVDSASGGARRGSYRHRCRSAWTWALLQAICGLRQENAKPQHSRVMGALGV